MFWPDVIELKQFYESPAGMAAAQSLRRRMRAAWPENGGNETVLGIGYALPLLQGMRQARSLAAMPAAQGVIHWPVNAGERGNNRTMLVDEAALPLPDRCVDKVVLLHVLENSELARNLLDEAWRVLAPGGRLLLIAPNRRGIWARLPGSPFAHGRPFSPQQLRDLAREHRFTPRQSQALLFFPPSQKRFVLRASRLWEGIGRRLFPGFGGVLMLDAEKQLYAPVDRGGMRQRVTAALSPRPALVPQGQTRVSSR